MTVRSAPEFGLPPPPSAGTTRATQKLSPEPCASTSTGGGGDGGGGDASPASKAPAPPPPPPPPPPMLNASRTKTCRRERLIAASGIDLHLVVYPSLRGKLETPVVRKPPPLEAHAVQLERQVSPGLEKQQVILGRDRR